MRHQPCLPVSGELFNQGGCIICFFLLSLSHMKTENFPLESTPQLSSLSEAHLDVDINFFADSGRYMISSRVILCFIPSSSVIVNIIVPMLDAIVLHATPVIPTFGAGRMFTIRFNN